MAPTTADILVDRLIRWEVDVVFGMPGDGINGIMEALRKRQDEIRFIQVRHEEAAALAACGHAKFTGKLAACLATSGPGGIHLLNGLYDAKLDGQPVLAITGNTYHDLMGTYGQQDVSLDMLFQDVTVYNERVMGPAHVETATDLACRHALAYHGVAHLTFPVDLQDYEYDKSEVSMHSQPHHTSVGVSHRAGLPDEQALRHAADVLNAAKKVAIVCGRGAIGAGQELEEAANRLAAPIIKALLGKTAVPDDSPFTTGGLGLLGTAPSQEALESCDALLWVGSSFPYIEFLPKPGQARMVQIDANPIRIGLRYPAEVGLVGDSKQTLQHLLPLLERKDDRSFLEEAQKNMNDWWALMEERGTRQDVPMKPQVVAWELGQRLAHDAIVTCDSGTNTVWWARYIKAKQGQMHSVSGNLATMGCALPYAVAAQLAYPNRQVVAFVGDGGLSMMMGELATCVKYNLPIKIVVIKNNTLGQIRWEQMAFLGNPEYGCELQPINFAGIAQACGLVGLTVEDPAKCGDVLAQALATPGPVLVEAVVDPNEPPMPPKTKPKQALNMAEALASGQPDGRKIALSILGDRVREMV